MKLLIVDDDGLIRDSLKILFEAKEPSWAVDTAADGESALEHCRAAESLPDIILMDIRMPNCDGVTATRRIKADFPEVKIVMLTTFTDEGYISSAINAGAEGYLLKSTPADGIIERIRAVEKGAMVFDKGVKLTASENREPPRASCPADRPIFADLTERELEILTLIATGLSNNEIAAKLFLSQGTVRNAVSAILEKLDLRDRTQLAVCYWQNA
jgi:DNA-binding NarL/FixJ family response regulator